MKSYFKYTNGEAFTLDGQDYAGFLHFSNGLPYTGKIDSDDMDLLVPKNTFMTQFYLNQGDFNTTFRNIESNTPFFSNVNDLVNLQGMLTMLRHLNKNNLICFKNLILGHPTIYQFEKNNNFFYGLSSTVQVDLRGQRTLRNTIRFADSTAIFNPVPDIGSNNWRFLDEITTGSFTVGADESFVYFCSDGDFLYALRGSFSDDGPIEYLGNQAFRMPTDSLAPDNIHNIYHDEDANQLFIVFNDTMSIFDTSSFKDCQSLDSLLLVDIIPLGQTSTITHAHVWGTTFEEFGFADFTFGASITIDNPNKPQYVKVGNNIRTSFDSGLLSCFNKYSDDLVQVLNLQTFNISALYSIDIRNTDDNILLLYRHTNQSLKLLYIDSDLLTFEDHFIYSLNDSDRFTVRFSGIDSDMFYISTKTEYQTRFLSAPEWPCGRLETGEIHYPLGYTWIQAKFLWGSFDTPWGGTVSEASSFNNLTSAEIIKNNKMYMILHNVGRIYAFDQPPDDRFFNALPLNTVSNYSELACSETSLGLYFNASISFIVRDILILYSKSFGSFNIRERSVVVQNLQDLVSTTNNLYINGNETFNVLTIQRILILLNDLQTALLSKSLEK